LASSACSPPKPRPPCARGEAACARATRRTHADVCSCPHGLQRVVPACAGGGGGGPVCPPHAHAACARRCGPATATTPVRYKGLTWRRPWCTAGGPMRSAGGADAPSFLSGAALVCVPEVGVCAGCRARACAEAVFLLRCCMRSGRGAASALALRRRWRSLHARKLAPDTQATQL
jgi:hypothetical protein